MSAATRRRALARLGGWTVAFGAVASGAVRLHAQETEGRTIEIEARRFCFTPAEVLVKQGETVTVALKSLDFAHGFSIPDLGVRTDLVPGKVVKLRLELARAGRYTFLCDNFCGDDHEQMGGLLIVGT